MKRAVMVVVCKSGERYDANHLAVTFWTPATRPGEPYTGVVSMLSFECSGKALSIPAEMVDRIEFAAAGAEHCPYCDGTIRNLVGDGIHA